MLSARCRVSPGIFVYPPGRDVVTFDLLSPEALRAAVAGLDFELVDVRISGPASRCVVRVWIDVRGGGVPGAGVTTDDCARVSRALEAELESAGAVGPRYIIEVSSPGIERPIRFAEHWRRYIGHEVRVKARGIAGKVTARIAGVPEEDHVDLVINGIEQRLPLDAVREATLVVDWSAIG
jgi:ribosome maturation factor RimP